MQQDTSQATGQAVNYLHWTLVAALGVASLAELAGPGTSPALLWAIIALAALASITALTRQLPWTNVLFAAALVALMGGTVHGLSARTGIPFGPVTFNAAAGSKLFNFVPWTVPLLWIVAVFNSRGVARLVLRPWRKVKNYGLWLMILAAVLAMVFDLALEPFAAQVKHLWFWQPTKLPFTWHDASLMSFLGWLCVSLLILAFVLPFLIRKQPGKPRNPDFAPLVLWLGAMGLFTVGVALAALWSAVAVNAILIGIVAVFCWRGARW